MVNNFVDFPDYLNEALEEIGLEYNLKLKKETHYEAIDRELQRIHKNRLDRLNFTFDSKNSLVKLTHYADAFPLFPKFLIWCHNFIPGFPYLGKIKWESLTDLPVGLSKEEYKVKVTAYVRTIFKQIS